MNSSAPDKTATLNRTQALECVPRQNNTVQWQKLDSGDILFTYPIPLNRFFQSLHRKFSKNQAAIPTKKLQLDQMGSFVWQLIDGKKTVREIITIFAKKYKITGQEAETAVTTFLRTLGQKGFIGLS
ncbi:MAG: PqqD family protein [Desulfocapsa sp.]|nr:PqqD family protein [Desulfocapsa sp.]